MDICRRYTRETDGISQTLSVAVRSRCSSSTEEIESHRCRIIRVE
jgi:hypothetical protein